MTATIYPIALFKRFQTAAQPTPIQLLAAAVGKYAPVNAPEYKIATEILSPNHNKE